MCISQFREHPYTVKYCPLRERNTEKTFFQYYPTFEDNTEINHNYSLKEYNVCISTQLVIYSQIYPFTLARQRAIFYI